MPGTGISGRLGVTAQATVAGRAGSTARAIAPGNRNLALHRRRSRFDLRTPSTSQFMLSSEDISLRLDGSSGITNFPWLSLIGPEYRW